MLPLGRGRITAEPELPRNLRRGRRTVLPTVTVGLLLIVWLLAGGAGSLPPPEASGPLHISEVSAAPHLLPGGVLSGPSVPPPDTPHPVYRPASGFQEVALLNLSLAPTSLAFDAADGGLYVASATNPELLEFNGSHLVASWAPGAPLGFPNLLGEVYDPSNGTVYEVASNGLVIGVVGSSVSSVSPPVGAGPLSSFLQPAYDPVSAQSYIPWPGGDSVVPVSGPTVGAALPAPTGAAPQAVAFDSANQALYVADSGSAQVTVFSAGKAVANLSVGKDPYDLVYDPADQEVYVSNAASDNVSVINGTRVVASVGVYSSPEGVAYDPAAQAVLVANAGSGSFSEILGTSLGSTVALALNPSSLAVDPVNSCVYAAGTSSDQLEIVGPLPSLCLVGSVVLTPDSVNVDPGQSAAISGEAFAPAGQPIPGASFSWQVTPPALASLNATTGSSVRITAGASTGLGHVCANATYDGYASFNCSLVNVGSNTSPYAHPVVVQVGGYSPSAIVLNWNVSSDPHFSNYTAQVNGSSPSTWVTFYVATTAQQTRVYLGSLHPGVNYTWRVLVEDPYGYAASSPLLQPLPPVPPLSYSASAGSSWVLSWTNPAHYSSQIVFESYTILLSAGGGAPSVVAQPTSVSPTSYPLQGLQTGVTYTAFVTVTDGCGTCGAGPLPSMYNTTTVTFRLAVPPAPPAPSPAWFGALLPAGVLAAFVVLALVLTVALRRRRAREPSASPAPPAAPPGAPGAPGTLTTCPYCGTPRLPNALHCPACGSPYSRDAAPGASAPGPGGYRP